MYDELVKSLRETDFSYGCPCGAEPLCKDKDCVILQAADAIEGLRREVEEYKDAYRKEHNKRIAENRYLYDELTKALRAKLLMTPMRIEIPQPPKEET